MISHCVNLMIFTIVRYVPITSYMQYFGLGDCALCSVCCFTYVPGMFFFFFRCIVFVVL